jgi:hypothetical protein
LDPLARLDVVLQQLARSRKDWDAAVVEADQAYENGRAAEVQRELQAVVRTAYDRWNEISAQADKLAKDAHRGEPMDDGFEKEYQQTLEQLRDQFDGGPHYELLCERVAGLHVRLKRMEANIREYPAVDHARLNQQLLSYINQLQKYTEAMKSESISKEAQGVAEKILLIVEKNLATSYPELWRGVMREVRVALESVAA